MLLAHTAYIPVPRHPIIPFQNQLQQPQVMVPQPMPGNRAEVGLASSVEKHDSALNMRLIHLIVRLKPLQIRCGLKSLTTHLCLDTHFTLDHAWSIPVIGARLITTPSQQGTTDPVFTMVSQSLLTTSPSRHNYLQHLIRNTCR